MVQDLIGECRCASVGVCAHGLCANSDTDFDGAGDDLVCDLLNG